MRRAYEKPVMTVERFLANVAVAACNREWDGTTTTDWEAQPISCYRSGNTEMIFSSSTSGCENYPTGIRKVDNGTYTQQQLVDAGLTSLVVDSKNGKNVTINEEIGYGYVLTWTRGGTNCSGPATAEIIQNMTSSY